MERCCYLEQQICGNCRHFVQHYVQLEGRFVPLGVGHCIYPRLKDRAMAETCRRWEAASNSTS